MVIGHADRVPGPPRDPGRTPGAIYVDPARVRLSDLHPRLCRVLDQQVEAVGTAESIDVLRTGIGGTKTDITAPGQRVTAAGILSAIPGSLNREFGKWKA